MTALFIIQILVTKICTLQLAYKRDASMQQSHGASSYRSLPAFGPSLSGSVKHSAICNRALVRPFGTQSNICYAFHLRTLLLTHYFVRDKKLGDIWNLEPSRHVRAGWFIVFPICRHPNPLPSRSATNVGEAARRALTDHLCTTRPFSLYFLIPRIKYTARKRCATCTLYVGRRCGALPVRAGP